MGPALIHLASLTVRYVIEDREVLDQNRARGPGVYAFWHNQLLCAGYYFRNMGFIVLVSRHFDGECIGRIIRRLGFRTASGSSTRGGVKSLIELAHCLDQGGEVAFTADGPRGPRYKAKPGPVFLARKKGIPLLCFHIEPKAYWELSSWDGLRIPKPFTRALVKIGRPMWIPENESNTEGLARLQAEMDRLKRYSESYWDQGLS